MIDPEIIRMLNNEKKQYKEKIKKLELRFKLTEDILELQCEMSQVYKDLYLFQKEITRQYKAMFNQLFGNMN